MKTPHGTFKLRDDTQVAFVHPGCSQVVRGGTAIKNALKHLMNIKKEIIT